MLELAKYQLTTEVQDLIIKSFEKMEELNQQLSNNNTQQFKTMASRKLIEEKKLNEELHTTLKILQRFNIAK